MILGLDISSSKTGISCVTDKGELYFFTYLDTQTTTKKKKEQFKDIFDKIKYITDYFEEFYKAHPGFPKITEIHVEGPLSKFTPGRSSMHTLETLFQMNYSVCFELYRIFGIKPIYWHPSSVRTINGLKIKRGEDVKARVFEYVCNTFPTFKSAITDLNKKMAKNSPWIDVADSVLIASAGWKTKTSNQ